jgi:outer membrane protein assembly factor BamD
MEKKWFLLLIFSLFLFSCSDFNKVVKSTDYEYKYKKAQEYYSSGDYTRANTLFQDLVHVYRGTSRGDELYYTYGQSLFKQSDYILAGHYFKSIIDQYPRSKYAEEAQFMVGYCFFKDSPSAKLDQDVSRKAIDALLLFINVYPYSDKVQEANLLIDELHEKIAYKAYVNAKLYYDMGYFKAAVISLGNCLNDFPDSKYREELRYLLFKGKYNLAVNSVEDKKRERLNDARDEYFNFVDEFPESKHSREVNRDFKQLSQLLGYTDNEEISTIK